MILFIVKTIHVNQNDEDDVYWEDSSDAVYFDAKSAYDNVSSNWGDLCEAGYNQYAVILATQGGLYPTSDELAWFKWNVEESAYEPCDRPDFMDGIYFGL